MTPSKPSWDSCWMVWMWRQHGWVALHFTASYRRRDAIANVERLYPDDPTVWRQKRRAGVWKCVRTTLCDLSPLEILKGGQP